VFELSETLIQRDARDRALKHLSDLERLDRPNGIDAPAGDRGDVRHVPG
jgi:hypothetical protein